MLAQIAQWIENQAAGFTIGVNLFIGHLPLKRADDTEPPDRCTVLLENAGGGVYPDIPDRVDKLVQVYCRSKKYTEAQTDSETIYNLLHARYAFDLPDYEAASGTEHLCMASHAQAVPAPIGQDQNDRWQFSTNFILRIRDKQT